MDSLELQYLKQMTEANTKVLLFFVSTLIEVRTSLMSIEGLLKADVVIERGVPGEEVARQTRETANAYRKVAQQEIAALLKELGVEADIASDLLH